MAVDYSSQSYWQGRLAKEREVGFEWLVPTSAIIPIVYAHGMATTHRSQILHFGCGSSSLGLELQAALGNTVFVTDADYATVGLRPDDSSTDTTRNVPLVDLDVLSRQSLIAKSPAAGWDLLVDKSTADAISCGPRIPQDSSGGIERDAIQVLCDNLASVTRLGGRWVSISYSSERFNFLSTQEHAQWQVTEKLPVRLIPSTTTGSSGIVYQPEEGVWAWVLTRVDTN